MTQRITQRITQPLIVLAIVALSLSSLIACGPQQEPTDPGISSGTQGVKMPPLASLQIDFNLLAQAKQNVTIKSLLAPRADKTSANHPLPGFAYKHVTNAIVRSGAAGLVIGVGLVPYAQTYGALLAAGFQFDGKVFRAQATIKGEGGAVIPVSGVATPNLLAGTLSVVITRDGQTLSTGTSDLVASRGSWTLHGIKSGIAAVHVDWSASSAAVNVSGEIIDTTHKNVGTKASVSADAAGVVTLSYDLKPGNGPTTVTYDSASHVGSLEAADYNGGFRSCWDATFRDTTCP